MKFEDQEEEPWGVILQATSPFHFMLPFSFHLANHDSYKWGHSTLVFGYFGLVID